MDNDEPKTREEWMANNRSIMEQEHFSEKEIYLNEIETRLAFSEELRNEDDERLGDAYVACLANHEYRPDAVALGEAWAPLTADQLVSEFQISRKEAVALTEMANKEYEDKDPLWNKKVVIVYDTENMSGTVLAFKTGPRDDEDYLRQAKRFMWKRSVDEGWGGGIDGLEFTVTEIEVVI